MVQLLMWCDVHGPVEDNNVMMSVTPWLAEATSVSIVYGQAQCRVCGRTGETMAGVYAVNADDPTIVDFAPTPEVADRLRLVVDWARWQLDNGVDPDVVKDHVERAVAHHAPGLKVLLDRVLSNRVVAATAVLTFIMGTLTFLGLDPASQQAQHQERSITQDEMRELFEEYFGEHGVSQPKPRNDENPPASPRG